MCNVPAIKYAFVTCSEKLPSMKRKNIFFYSTTLIRKRKNKVGGSSSGVNDLVRPLPTTATYDLITIVVVRSFRAVGNSNGDPILKLTRSKI